MPCGLSPKSLKDWLTNLSVQARRTPAKPDFIPWSNWFVSATGTARLRILIGHDADIDRHGKISTCRAIKVHHFFLMDVFCFFTNDSICFVESLDIVVPSSLQNSEILSHISFVCLQEHPALVFQQSNNPQDVLALSPCCRNRDNEICICSWLSRSGLGALSCGHASDRQHSTWPIWSIYFRISRTSNLKPLEKSAVQEVAFESLGKSHNANFYLPEVFEDPACVRTGQGLEQICRLLFGCL